MMKQIFSADNQNMDPSNVNPDDPFAGIPPGIILNALQEKIEWPSPCPCSHASQH